MSEYDYDGLTVTEYDHAPPGWPFPNWQGEARKLDAPPESWRSECVPEDLFEDAPF